MLVKAVHRARFGPGGRVVDVGAAEGRVVAREQLGVGAGQRRAHLVVIPPHRIEVADHQDHPAPGVPPQKGDDRLLVVVRHDPLEALPAVIDLPEGALLFVEGVELADIPLQLAVLFVVEQHPVELVLLGPLAELAHLLAHKEQLFAGVGHHVAVEGAQVGELGVIVARHLVDEAALAVHHLVVADRQHKVLTEGVEEAEGHLLVVAGPEERIGAHVADHVVHPAHVPLEVEAEPAVLRGLGHQRPGGGLLRDHQPLGVAAQHGAVELLQKGDGLEVLLAAVLVGLPLAVLAVVVEVKHAGHRVHPQPVDVVLLDPEQGRRDEEALDLGHAVVEDHGAPLAVLAPAGVGILVAGLSVIHVQAIGVLGEVGGHPVHNHPDAGGVALVHKQLEVVGRAEPAGGGKVPGDLIAPAAVERMLGDGQQLDVGIAHLEDVGQQHIGQLGVVVGRAILFGAPAAEVHLVDVDGRVDQIGAVLGLLPGGILPLVALQLVDLAAVGGACLGVEGIRIRLEEQVVGRRGDAVFVDIILLNAGDERLPNPAVLQLGHRVAARHPAVEIAHDADRLGVGGPGAEHHPVRPVLLCQVRAEKAVRLKVGALPEKI